MKPKTSSAAFGSLWRDNTALFMNVRINVTVYRGGAREKVRRRGEGESVRKSMPAVAVFFTCAFRP